VRSESRVQFPGDRGQLIRPSPRLGIRHLHLADDPIDRHVKQVVLAGEVRVDRRRAGFQLVSDAPHAQAVEPFCIDHRQQGVMIPIWKSFPLTSGPAAHREVETGHVRGKVVLEV